MPHHESRSFRMRECGEGNLHLFSQLDVVRQSFWSRRGILYQRHGIVFRSFFADRWLDLPSLFFLALPHAVDGVIRRDAINPGPKVRSCLKLSKLLVRSQKRLL